MAGEISANGDRPGRQPGKKSGGCAGSCHCFSCCASGDPERGVKVDGTRPSHTSAVTHDSEASLATPLVTPPSRAAKSQTSITPTRTRATTGTGTGPDEDTEGYRGGCCRHMCLCWVLLMLLLMITIDATFIEGDMQIGTLIFLVPMLLPLLIIARLIKDRQYMYRDYPGGVPESTGDLLLRSLGDQGVAITNQSKDQNTVAEAFNHLANGGDAITVASLQQALQQEKVIKFIKDLNDPVLKELVHEERGGKTSRGCCQRPAVDLVFEVFDEAGNGVISLDEWVAHMGKNREILIRFALKANFQAKRVYWAMTPEEKPTCSEFLKAKYGLGRTLCGVVTDFNHYKEDLIFYAANNHPILSLFCSHPLSALKRKEHLWIELWSMGITMILCEIVIAITLGHTALTGHTEGHHKIGEHFLQGSTEGFLDLVIGQLLIVTPTIMLSIIGYWLVAWPIFNPKNGLLQQGSPSTIKWLRCYISWVMVCMTAVILPVMLFIYATQGKLVKWLFFRGVAYLEWFPIQIYAKYLPLNIPGLPILWCRQYGRWWRQREESGEPKKLWSTTSMNVLCMVFSLVGNLLMSLMCGYFVLIWRLAMT